MRTQTSLDIANAMLLYEISNLKKVMHLMSASEITSDLAAIKRTYIEKSGWESLYDSEMRKQELDKYIPELNQNMGVSIVRTYEDKFAAQDIEEDLEMELDL